MPRKSLILIGALTAASITAVACGKSNEPSSAQPQQANAAEPLPLPGGIIRAEDGTKTTPVRGADGKYEPGAFLLASGVYANKAAYASLDGSGPNKSKKFYVEYTASLGYNFNEYHGGGHRHCRWNYPPPSKIDRVLYVEETPPKLKVVATQGSTKAAPDPDNTQDNCWNVWNNVIQPRLIKETSNTPQGWKSWIDQDMVEVKRIIANPLP